MWKIAVAFLGGIVVVLIALPLMGGGGEETPVAAPAPAAAPPPSPVGTPAVVRMSPANGASGVSTAMTQLEIEFNMPMGGGFSFTTRGHKDRFPEGTGKPRWSADGKTCIMPVRLEPNRSYIIGINSRSRQNFRSAAGTPLPMVTWTFSTGGA